MQLQSLRLGKLHQIKEGEVAILISFLSLAAIHQKRKNIQNLHRTVKIKCKENKTGNQQM